MGDAGRHIDEITRLDECLLALVHEASPAAHHVHRMKTEFVAMSRCPDPQSIAAMQVFAAAISFPDRKKVNARA